MKRAEVARRGGCGWVCALATRPLLSEASRHLRPRALSASVSWPPRCGVGAHKIRQTHLVASHRRSGWSLFLQRGPSLHGLRPFLPPLASPLRPLPAPPAAEAGVPWARVCYTLQPWLIPHPVLPEWRVLWEGCRSRKTTKRSHFRHREVCKQKLQKDLRCLTS